MPWPIAKQRWVPHDRRPALPTPPATQIAINSQAGCCRPAGPGSGHHHREPGPGRRGWRDRAAGLASWTRKSHARPLASWGGLRDANAQPRMRPLRPAGDRAQVPGAGRGACCAAEGVQAAAAGQGDPDQGAAPPSAAPTQPARPHKTCPLDNSQPRTSLAWAPATTTATRRPPPAVTLRRRAARSARQHSGRSRPTWTRMARWPASPRSWPPPTPSAVSWRRRWRASSSSWGSGPQRWVRPRLRPQPGAC